MLCLFIVISLYEVNSLFIGVIPSKKICTKTLLPDLCYSMVLSIVVLMVFCDLENGSRIYFYNYFVQRTILKLQLWDLCLIWLLVLWCFTSFQLQLHSVLHVFLFLPCLSYFSCLLLSVSFQFLFKTLENLPCCKLKFTSATEISCFLSKTQRCIFKRKDGNGWTEIPLCHSLDFTSCVVSVCSAFVFLSCEHTDNRDHTLLMWVSSLKQILHDQMRETL